jgi:hypothetical protein
MSGTGNGTRVLRLVYIAIFDATSISFLGSTLLIITILGISDSRNVQNPAVIGPECGNLEVSAERQLSRGPRNAPAERRQPTFPPSVFGCC